MSGVLVAALYWGSLRDKLPMFCAVRQGMIFDANVLDANFEREMSSLIALVKQVTAFPYSLDTSLAYFKLTAWK